jgi:alpha-ketoglutarate-dependent taurine dioxygenase
LALAPLARRGYFFSVKSEGDDFISSDNDVLKEGTVTSAAENMAQQVDGEKQTDIAYSNMKLMLHVDNPYRDPYPQYQLLHCVQAAPPGKGGESIIADGFHAAEILRRDFPAMFNILATTKMRVQYKDATTEQVGGGGTRAQKEGLVAAPAARSLDPPNSSFALARTQIRFVPCIETDPTTGDPCDPSTQTVKKIASSSRLDYCPNLPPAEAQLFYEAKQKWLQTIHSPEVALSWRLNDGDMLIVDNGRVMHGREAFENDVRAREPPRSRRSSKLITCTQATTTRHLEGCYMDRDSLFSSYLVLGRDEQKSTAEVTAVRVVDAPVAAPVEKTKLDNSAKVRARQNAACQHQTRVAARAKRA